MSTHSPEASRPEPVELPELPELDAARIDAIEQSVFSDIRASSRRTRARRGRWIGVGAAAAAVVVVAAVIAPAMPGIMGVAPVDTPSAVSPQTSPEFTLVVPGSGGGSKNAVDGATQQAESAAGADAASGSADTGMSDVAGTGVFGAGRDIAVTGSATLTVDGIPGAAALVASAAEARGGTVQSMSVGTNQPPQFMTDGKVIAPMPTPEQNYGWITVQVPAAELNALIADLDGIGTVTALSTDRQDVTSYALDLQARTDAARASVDRLHELVAGASTVSELIEADVALSERQATLESYEQQLAQLKNQVTMSTLSVNLTLAAEPAAANPAGFGDGVSTGWASVVAALNALVISLGFLVPWIAIVAVLGAVVWAIVALVRRARGARRTRRAGSADTGDTANTGDSAEL